MGRRKHNMVLRFFQKVTVNVVRVDYRENDFCVETCKYWKIRVNDEGAMCW